YLRAAPLIERLVARVGEREIVLSRFVYGTRIASMFFWGVHRLPYARFAAFDLVGCLLSAIVLAGLGFGLSTSAVALLGRVTRAGRSGGGRGRGRSAASCRRWSQATAS